jgi:hypothetical protein
LFSVVGALMMINLSAIRCSLAYAPYLAATFAEFLSDGAIASRVVRQAGRGLILRSDGDLILRHEHRQASLGREDARHYGATIQFRRDFYDALRMQDEVVLANVGNELLLSHPQSEMWLKVEAVATLVKTIATGEGAVSGLPDWLKVSTGGGRVLLSDQRTGRWVLLGADHMNELGRRLDSLEHTRGAIDVKAPPTIPLKGLTVHLQSALKLTETLEEFANTRQVMPFEEVTPAYSLRASGSTEGIELSDTNIRVAVNAREARKWGDIVRSQLRRLNVNQVERGAIRTVFAGNEDGRWVLQWGDEVFVSDSESPRLSTASEVLDGATGNQITRRIGDFLLLLDPATGGCVALTDSESKHLDGLDESVEGSRTGGAS